MSKILTIPTKNQALLSSPKHTYIVDRFDEAITRSIYTYRRTPYFVESDHILIKIIQSVGIPYEGNDRIYYQQVAARTTDIARAVGFNDINAKVGAARKNSFFGKDIREFILSYSAGDTDLLSLEGMWKMFRPVQIVYHPFNDLNLNIRNGEQTTGVTGHAVIRVDIPLLMLQFQKWKRWARANYDIMPTLTQFVFQFPVVNMLYSDIDMSYFNRLSSAALGKPIIPQKKNYSFALPDITNYVADDISYALEMATVKRRSLYELALGLCLIDNSTVRDFIDAIDCPITTSNAGVVSLGILPWLSTLAQLSFQSGSHDNGSVRNLLQKTIRAFKSAGCFRGLDTFADEQYIGLIYDQGIAPYLN